MCVNLFIVKHNLLPVNTTIILVIMDDPLKIPQGHLMKFASLDISSMYSNITPEK